MDSNSINRKWAFQDSSPYEKYSLGCFNGFFSSNCRWRNVIRVRPLRCPWPQGRGRGASNRHLAIKWHNSPVKLYLLLGGGPVPRGGLTNHRGFFRATWRPRLLFINFFPHSFYLPMYLFIISCKSQWQVATSQLLHQRCWMCQDSLKLNVDESNRKKGGGGEEEEEEEERWMYNTEGVFDGRGEC